MSDKQIIVNEIEVNGCENCFKLQQALDNIELICRQALDDEFVRPVAKEILKIIERK